MRWNSPASIGYPVIVRPAYTLGGTGGGIADDEEELREIAHNGIRLSRVGQVLIERCIAGWKEIEYEVMRDSKGNCITVCNMENLDPVGVHTGDSIVVAPSQSLSDKDYQMLRSSALNIISALGIQGGCNVQYALNPDSFEYAVIEVNPRVPAPPRWPLRRRATRLRAWRRKLRWGWGSTKSRTQSRARPLQASSPRSTTAW